MAPEVKTTKNSKLPKLSENYFEIVGRGGWPLISTWINTSSLGSSGLHCVDFPHQMRKFLLNLAPGEPLALVQEMPFFDSPIKSDPTVGSYKVLLLQMKPDLVFKPKLFWHPMLIMMLLVLSISFP